MHHRNPGMRVKVQLPLKLSVENAEYLEATYGGEYRKHGSSYRGYGTWIFSRVTEDRWKDFERDIAEMRGEVVQILKGNPLGEILVVAGANPKKRRGVGLSIDEVEDIIRRALEKLGHNVSGEGRNTDEPSYLFVDNLQIEISKL